MGLLSYEHNIFRVKPAIILIQDQNKLKFALQEIFTLQQECLICKLAQLVLLMHRRIVVVNFYIAV